MEIQEKTVNLLYTSWSDENTPITNGYDLDYTEICDNPHFFDFSNFIGLGLGGKYAFISAATYVGIPTIIAAVLSFIFSKFKFKSSSFFKFWFWTMLITTISYFANSIANT